MNFQLKIWRQTQRKSPGKLVDYEVRDISPHTSFLEMLDILNEKLLGRGEEPIAFDSDCREGICGTCSLTINGEAHGPDHPGAVCELYMRKFRDGATITVEPFRVGIFPDRQGSGDRSQRAGSHRASRWVHFRARRFRARSEFDSRFPSTMPTWPWKPRPASAAARAPRRVQTDRPCSSLPRKSRTSRSCHRDIRNGKVASLKMVQRDGRGRFRQLH